jgi:hypothetical protein
MVPVKCRGGLTLEARQIDIASVIETMPIGRTRLQIFAVCYIIQLMDGFDTQASEADWSGSAYVDRPVWSSFLGRAIRRDGRSVRPRAACRSLRATPDAGRDCAPVPAQLEMEKAEA